MKTILRTFLSVPLWLALLTGLGGRASAASSAVVSPAFTVDTRSASTLSGRVVAASTRQPLGGATVTVAGVTTTTDGTTGVFRFTSISAQTGAVVAVAKTGYVSTQRTITATLGAKTVELGDIALGQVLANGAAPQVVGVTPAYNGLFLEGVSLSNSYETEVNWNGGTPASVEWSVNGALRATTPASGNKTARMFDMNTEFPASLGTVSQLEVVAVAADGKRSPKFALPVKKLPLPAFLQGVLPIGYLDRPDVVLSYELTLPKSDGSDPANVWRTLPFLGKFGGGFNVSAGVEYALRSGEWQFHIGTTPLSSWKGRVGERPHSTVLNPQFYLGNRSLDFGVQGMSEGVANFTEGFRVNNVGVTLSLDFKAEVLTFYLTDYVPGTQWVRLMDKVLKPFGVDPNSVQRVRVYGLVGAQLQLVAELYPKLGYGGATFGMEVGLEAAYEPDLKFASMKIYVGGKVGATLAWPSGGALNLKDVTGKIYGGINAEVFSINVLNAEFVLLDYKWVVTAGASAPELAELASYARVQIDGQDYVAIPILSAEDPTPAERSYLVHGPELFQAGAEQTTPARARAALSSGAGSLPPLEGFRLMGLGRIAGAEGGGEEQVAVSAGDDTAGAARAVPARAAAVAAAAPAQADVPLVTNAYPNAAPALAGRANELMLLYVKDNGGAALQFTDIVWTRFDGTNWSPPAAIATDTRAEFAPQVRYDGNGDAIAVWQRVKSATFTTVDVAAMAAQMEIVWSRWDRASGLWSVPAALTDNATLDQRPLLSGPMTNGDVLLVWTANDANLFSGTGAVGAATNSRFLSATWGAATKTWGAVTTVVSGVTGEKSPSFDGQGSRAVLAWGRDLDGDLTTPNDSEIFYCKWENGSWGTPVRMTTNVTPDTNVRVAVGSTGDTHLVWRAGSDLGWSLNFGVPVVARAGADTSGFADFALTVGPGGNVVLLWQEKSVAGSDMYFRIFDPAAASWGQDDLLTADAPLERSFSPVWDAAGNLTVAYLKVQMSKTTKTVTLEGGAVLTIDNVPQGGQVDLYATKRALVRDLALVPGDFVVTGGNFLPGDLLTLTATVRNVGNVAVQNPKVAFFNGNPTAGGVKIGEAAATGWLQSADKTDLAVTWSLPTATAAVQLYAVVDPDGTVTENREDNNQQTVGVGGADLVARYRSSTVANDGSLRIIAEVQNSGMPATPATTLQAKAATGGAVLAQVNVPALQPGEIAQVALDLPAGSHPAGEFGFALEADASSAITDANRFNNRTVFSSNLWLPPTIAAQPVGAQAAATGGSASFRVTAAGGGPFTYQWSRNGVAIQGATRAVLSLTNVQSGDAGSYAVFVTNNSASSVTSNAGVLSVVAAGNSASHAVTSMAMSAGDSVTVANTFSYTGAPASVTWQVLLPGGWSFASDSGATGATRPAVGATDLLEWTWPAAAVGTTAFTYTLNRPAGLNGAAELVALVTVGPSGGAARLLAQPDPLVVTVGTARHSSDTDGDGRIGLFELTRVIELFNTRNGTTRTGRYGVATATEDGFAPDGISTTNQPLARYHSCDANRDGQINLFELTRVIELYNTRIGTIRTGQYHVQTGTEDGFAPGP